MLNGNVCSAKSDETGMAWYTYTGLFAVVHLGGNQGQQAIEGFGMVAQALLYVWLGFSACTLERSGSGAEKSRTRTVAGSQANEPAA